MNYRFIQLAAVALMCSTGYALSQIPLSVSGSNAQVSTALSSHITQIKLADCATLTREFQSDKGFTLQTIESGLSITGTDSKSRRWSALLPSGSALKCEVWSARLPETSSDSLLILSSDQMGGQYGAELTVLSFDKEGRPMPWQAAGHFTSSSRGIDQLAQNSATGKGQVVVSQREGEPHAGFAFVDHLYSLENGQFAKVVGADSVGNKWPRIQGNSKALSGHESAPDVNHASASNTKSILISNVLPFSEAEPVVLSNGSSVRYPSIVVLDQANGDRQISFAQHVPDAVKSAANHRASISLQSEICEEEECRPLVLFAVEP